MRDFTVTTERRTQLVDVTAAVRGALDGELDGASAVLVYVPHTTAGVTINEHADPMVARDFEAAMERMVADDWGWQNIEDGQENAPSHIPASPLSPQVLRPVSDGVSRSAPGRASASASSTARARAPF